MNDVIKQKQYASKFNKKTKSNLKLVHQVMNAAVSGKNIYLLVCNGGNIRNTWRNFENVLKGNTIVSEIDLVYPVRNGITEAKRRVNEWIAEEMGECGEISRFLCFGLIKDQ